MEPAGIVLPDSTYIPRDHPVALADLQLGRQPHLTHQRQDVLTRVHTGHGLIVDIGHRVPQPRQLSADPVTTRDRSEMAREQDLRTEFVDRFDRLDHRQRVTIAVTTHRDQVGYVTEQGPEDIAAQADTFFGQPYHEAIGRLPAWCRMQLEASATEFQLELLVDDDRRNWRALWGQRAAGSFHCVRDRGRDLIGPGERRVCDAEVGQQLVVAPPRLPISLGDNLTTGVDENVRPTDVVIVALGEDHISDG